MPKIEYMGTSSFREISGSDWASVDVTDQVAVTWSNTKGFTRKGVHKIQEVSDAAAAFLLENEKGDWKLVKEEAPADTDDTGDASGTDTGGEGGAGLAADAVPPKTAPRRVKDGPQA